MSEKRRVKGLWIHRPIVYGSVATAIPVEERLNNPEHNMRWTVAVRSATSPPPDSPILAQRTIPEDIIGGCDDLSYFIKKVSFKLHDSYPNPLRVIDKSPFELSETGWGEFIIYIKIHFHAESGEKAVQLQHPLKLHDWTHDPILDIPPVWLNDDPTKNEDHLETGKKEEEEEAKKPESTIPEDVSVEQASVNVPPPSTTIEGVPSTNKTPPTAIHSWQYDEIVFTDPTEGLYTKLIANPPTPLPPTNRYPPGIVKQIGNKGEHGEFTSDISQREFKKLDWAELKLLIEIDRLKADMGYPAAT
ncbi:hypothetical protein MJO28_002192 [Puccinia striiformis f. sp. tritici]|uniref:Uncharacterized protein n=1 Tax=Puccinia striiformis f. sp. tritici TaxID=168172 RepID=A0ACC0EZ78_9BASI|nr:hypothetical protein MJO28_002192 [Puccinia striiformis f. sp. tritici]